jgi:hypothetical protein
MMMLAVIFCESDKSEIEFKSVEIKEPCKPNIPHPEVKVCPPPPPCVDIKVPCPPKIEGKSCSCHKKSEKTDKPCSIRGCHKKCGKIDSSDNIWNKHSHHKKCHYESSK